MRAYSIFFFNARGFAHAVMFNGSVNPTAVKKKPNKHTFLHFITTLKFSEKKKHLLSQNSRLVPKKKVLKCLSNRIQSAYE